MNRTLYIIATTSRSGSTHLCRMLTSTRALGEPAEYYNVRVKPQRMKLWNAANDLDYFRQMLLRTSTDNNVCGVKVATLAFENMRRELGPVFELLRPKYIWLRRRDTLRQAISLYRANETDIWHWHTHQAKPQAVPRYDPRRIRQCQRQIENANESWADWFTSEQCQPLKLWYEDVTADPHKVVEQISAHLGIKNVPLRAIKSDLKIMRDETTESWVEKLRPPLR